MRGKKTAINTVFSLMEEIVAVICGFILPRLILTAFGSKYNGLTTSVSQFLTCAVLLRSGIGGATRAALYKPIAEENHDKINSIVKATDIFMKKIGVTLAGLILLFATLYPFLVKNEFGWFFTFSLFLIIGASTFAESFFGITYLIVLQADQKLWVSSLLKMICYVLNTAIGAVLILNGFSIHIVKLGGAIVYVAYPIILGLYVRKHYDINSHVAPDNAAISQRWDAFWQQVAVFVMNNTDVIVLTIFTNMLEVSVYSVYNMVIHGLKRAVYALSSGLEAAFGNMIAKGENRVLKENVGIIENLIYATSTIVYTCAALLILSFVSIYTRKVTDVEYIRSAFAYIIIFSQFFNGVRIPYQLVVQAAGHYKQTKIGAIVEPIINISLSVFFVFKYGLVGVAVGTLAATIFRTLQYSMYMRKNIVIRNKLITIFRMMVSFVESGIIIVLVKLIKLDFPEGYSEWVLNAIIIGLISLSIVTIGNTICFKKDMIGAYKKLKNLGKKLRH